MRPNLTGCAHEIIQMLFVKLTVFAVRDLTGARALAALVQPFAAVDSPVVMAPSTVAVAR